MLGGMPSTGDPQARRSRRTWSLAGLLDNLDAAGTPQPVPPAEPLLVEDKLVDETAGQGLRAYRRIKGLSQAELAEQSGVRQSRISELETGKRTLTTATQLKLASVLQVEPAWLLELPAAMGWADPLTYPVDPALEPSLQAHAAKTSQETTR